MSAATAMTAIGGVLWPLSFGFGCAMGGPYHGLFL